MTYGRDEHAYNVKRVEETLRTLRHAQDTLRALRVDLMQDVPIAGQVARDTLRAASIKLSEAQGLIDVATRKLPEPVL